MRKSSGLITAEFGTHAAVLRATSLTPGALASNVGEMPKLIQLRHVPDALYRQLKERAAAEELSLSDFLIREARKIVERPTMAEMRERLARRARVNPKPSPAEIIRRQRGKR